jgi:hypothetical protein
MFIPDDFTDNTVKITIKTKDHVYTLSGIDAQLWTNHIKTFSESHNRSESITQFRNGIYRWKIRQNPSQWISNKLQHLRTITSRRYQKTYEDVSLLRGVNV